MKMRALTLAFMLIALSGCQPKGAAIRIQEARAGATPPGATVAAAYMTITSANGDTLIAASTPIAATVEMHVSSEESGVTRMRPLPIAELKAGEPFTFAPGGAHFMLMGLQQPLAAESQFPLTLRFRNAGEVVVEVKVARPGQG